MNAKAIDIIKVICSKVLKWGIEPRRVTKKTAPSFFSKNRASDDQTIIPTLGTAVQYMPQCVQDSLERLKHLNSLN